jgi:hypothetical protein
MHAAKLIRHMRANGEHMSDEVLQRIRGSEKCGELVKRLTLEEQKHYASDIYQDLTDWLATESDDAIEHRYVALGMLRARQGIPFSNLQWAVCIAQEYLWQHMQQECLLEEPVEFWGGVILLRSLTQFFNRIEYFALLGYEQAAQRDVQVTAVQPVRS